MNKKEIFWLALFTFLTVLAWIIFDVYHAMTTSTITPIQQKLIKPLSHDFKTESMLRIVEKRTFKINTDEKN